PRLAAVGRFVQGALGAAVDQRPDVAAALVGRGEEHVGGARGEHDVGDAGVVADRQHLVPGATAVGRLEQAPVAAGPPQRPLRRHVHGVGAARVDDDPADVLGGRQADVLPRLAAVVGAVDAVAVADAALAVVLAGADPDHVRVLRVEHDGADGVRALVVGDGRPGGGGVGRLPDAAGGGGDVIMPAVFGVDGEADDAARGDGGADRAQLQAAGRGRDRGRVLAGGCGVGVGGWR